MRVIIFFIGICFYESLMKMSNKDYELPLKKHESAIMILLIYAFVLDVLDIISKFCK